MSRPKNFVQARLGIALLYHNQFAYSQEYRSLLQNVYSFFPPKFRERRFLFNQLFKVSNIGLIFPQIFKIRVAE